MAHLSKDEGLMNAFRNNLDVHTATAAEVFKVELNEVTSDQRRGAKAINFGLIYGMGAQKLGKDIGVDTKTAKAYIDTYFARYPGVREYMDRTRAQAADQGYVETFFGRRLYLPEINSNKPQERAAAERTAINAPMQARLPTSSRKPWWRWITGWRHPGWTPKSSCRCTMNWCWRFVRIWSNKSVPRFACT